ncbi:hypothetical protein ABPG74_000468 [Tetrahymena malaccensis]
MNLQTKNFRFLSKIILLLLLLKRACCCEDQLIGLLINQGFNPECDDQNNIVVDGINQQKNDVYLELSKSVITQTNRIIFTNFDQLSFKKIALNKIDRSFIDNLAFIQIQNSNTIIIEDVQIFYEQENNIFSFLIQNNSNVQINNFTLNFLNGYAPNLYESNPSVLRKQLVSQLINNKEVIILEYSFNYNQCEEILKEFNDIVGLYLSNSSTTLQKLNILINYNKQQVKFNNNFLINVFNADNYDNLIQMKEVNINLSAIKNEQGFVQTSGFIQFTCKYSNIMCGEIQIGTLNIINKNLILNMLIFENQYRVILQELNYVNSLFEEVLLVNQVGFIRSVLLINTQVKYLVLNKINIFRSSSYQYYYVLQLKNQNNDISFQLNEFNMLSSSWKNTMLYIYQDQQSENSQYFMINMKNSDYVGVFPLLFIFAQSVTLKVDIETYETLHIQNGLIQINYPNSLNMISSKLIINNTTDLNFGRGGIFQFFHCQFEKGRIVIKDFQFESFSNSVVFSRQGGVFYIHKGQIYFQNITASGLQIGGCGGFAYLKAYNITIENCSFQNFSSGLSGGTLFIYFENKIFINNVNVSNSQANLFGGGMYLYSTQENINSFYISKLRIENSTANIGGGISLNGMQDNPNITYINTKAQHYDRVSDTVKYINITQYAQYNPQLSEQQMIVNQTFNFTQQGQQINYNLNDFNIFQYFFLKLNLVMRNDEVFSFKDIFPQSQCQGYENNQPQANKKLSKDKKANSQSQQQCNFLNYFQQEVGYQEYQVDPNVQIFETQYQIDQGFFNMIQLNFIQNDFYVVIFLQDASLQYTVFEFQGFVQYINLFYLKTCFQGQIKKQIQNYCQYCSDFKVSISLNSTECYMCDKNKFYECSGNVTNLAEGYYILQQNNNLDLSQIQIFDCPIKENCKGGIEYGDKQCYESHVSHFCLECNHNKLNGNLYTRSYNYECNACQNFDLNKWFSALSILLAILLIAVIDFLIFFQYKSYKKDSNNQTDMTTIEGKKKRIGANVHFKFIFFFLQIINVCTYYQSPDIFKMLFSIQVYSFNPLSSSYLNFFECYLMQLDLNNSLNIFYLLMLLYLINSIQISIFTINAINLVVIQQLTAGISCQDYNQIGSYASIDLQKECDASDRKKYVIIYYIALVFYSVVFPLTLLWQLFKNKRNLQDKQVKYLYGFLYAEYKQEYFYWEFIRFFLVKILIIFFTRPTYPNIQTIGYPILVNLAVYFILISKCQPYQIDELQEYKEQDLPPNFELSFKTIKQFFKSIKDIFKCSYTAREKALIFSGSLLIICYTLNAISFENQYYQKSDVVAKIIAILGHFQALIILCTILCIFIKYIILKIRDRVNQSNEHNNQNQYIDLATQE